MGVELDRTRKYDSIKSMIDHLYRMASNPNHPDCEEAQEILEFMSRKIGFPFNFTRPKSMWCIS